jgi:hypothetical protein
MTISAPPFLPAGSDMSEYVTQARCDVSGLDFDFPTDPTGRPVVASPVTDTSHTCQTKPRDPPCRRHAEATQSRCAAAPGPTRSTAPGCQVWPCTAARLACGFPSLRGVCLLKCGPLIQADTDNAADTAVGCFAEPWCGDQYERAFTLITVEGDMTIDKCIKYAQARGYTYAALQSSHWWVHAAIVGAAILQSLLQSFCRAFAELLQRFCRAFAALLQSFCRAFAELLLSSCPKRLPCAALMPDNWDSAFRCFGGNDDQMSQYSSPGVCDYQCGGNSQQLCGGHCANQVYRTGVGSECRTAKARQGWRQTQRTA